MHDFLSKLIALFSETAETILHPLHRDNPSFKNSQHFAFTTFFNSILKYDSAALFIIIIFISLENKTRESEIELKTV